MWYVSNADRKRERDAQRHGGQGEETVGEPPRLEFQQPGVPSEVPLPPVPPGPLTAPPPYLPRPRPTPGHISPYKPYFQKVGEERAAKRRAQRNAMRHLEKMAKQKKRYDALKAAHAASKIAKVTNLLGAGFSLGWEIGQLAWDLGWLSGSSEPGAGVSYNIPAGWDQMCDTGGPRDFWRWQAEPAVHGGLENVGHYGCGTAPLWMDKDRFVMQVGYVWNESSSVCASFGVAEDLGPSIDPELHEAAGVSWWQFPNPLYPAPFPLEPALLPSVVASAAPFPLVGPMPNEFPQEFPIGMPMQMPAPQKWPDARPGRDIATKAKPMTATIPLSPFPLVQFDPTTVASTDVIVQPAPDVVMSVSATMGFRVRVRNRPDKRRRRPRKRKMEKKVHVGTIGRGIPWLVINAATEVQDFLEAMNNALPKKCRARGKGSNGPGKPQPQDIIRALYKCWDHFDAEKAIENFVNNEIEDWAYGNLGKAGKKLNQASGASTGGGSVLKEHQENAGMEELPLPTVSLDMETMEWELYVPWSDDPVL